MGIGGIGVSALAQILLAQGDALSGCDLQSSHITAKLEQLGVRVFVGHDPAHLDGVTRLVISDAIRADNPERQRAVALGLPVLRRSQLIGELMRERRGIAVSGTHGKTTTTAMTGLILTETGRDPTVLLGGELSQFGGNARAGAGDLVVAEACEAYESFLDFAPAIAVITNIEAEHLDHHHTEQAVIDSFTQFVARLRPGGALIYCADDANATAVAVGAGVRLVSYALNSPADYRASEVRDEGMGTAFALDHPAGRTEVRLAIPGAHNVADAVAAIAACAEAGVGVAESAAVLASFTGVARRFQAVATASGVTVVDDYAHHPTEIGATLAAARTRCQGRLVVVFQPHLYSRTRDFVEQFADALGRADTVVVAEIYAAREDPLPGVSGNSIVELLHSRGKKDAHFWPQKDMIAARLVERLAPGDWVLVLGAGDIGSVVGDLVTLLNSGAVIAGNAGRSACER